MAFFTFSQKRSAFHPCEPHALARHAHRGFPALKNLFVLSSLAGANMSQFATKFIRLCGACTVLALLVIAATPASAQKTNKKKAQQDAAADASAQADLKSMIDLPDGQAIDQAVGEALGYWQIGDTDNLHKYYSDDIVMVSGAWEPPVIGWDNFLKSYLAQRASVTGGRIDRSNTYVKVNGNSGWATYQFVYTAMADNRVVQFHGHTSVVLNKVAGKWVIVLNHSSIVDSTPPAAPQPVSPTAAAPPGRS
jgi:ketosteroid isomerase-like protein